MSFFKKVKQFLGIGTVKVDVVVGRSFKYSDPTVPGTVNITGKSDQKITKIEIKLVETLTTGKGEDKKVKTQVLGRHTITETFEVKEGQTVSREFDLPFRANKTGAEILKDQGGVLGGLGKLAAFAESEKLEFEVDASVTVEGVKLNPSGKSNINLAN